MRIVALAGGIGGARFLRGVQHAYPDAELTVVVNTGDDTTLYGLRICPDLDTVMYTLGGGIDEDRGWGRQDESWRAKEEPAGPPTPVTSTRTIRTPLRQSQAIERVRNPLHMSSSLASP